MIETKIEAGIAELPGLFLCCHTYMTVSLLTSHGRYNHRPHHARLFCCDMTFDKIKLILMNGVIVVWRITLSN